MDTIEREVRRERAAQTRRVMPMIGGLVDAWDGLSNDFKADVREESQTLANYLDRISAAVSD